jgi:hypothetical protein
VIYELRTYHVMPGRMPDLNRRFAEITLGFFAKYGIIVVGFWQNELGGASDELIYMLSYESLADREEVGRSPPTASASTPSRRRRRTARWYGRSPPRSCPTASRR